MYWCSNCGEKFDVPEIKDGDSYEFWGTKEHERISTCPCCGSDEIGSARNVSWEVSFDILVDGTAMDFNSLSPEAKEEIIDRIVLDGEMSGEFFEEV